jgi:hypothetical protein
MVSERHFYACVKESAASQIAKNHYLCTFCPLMRHWCGVMSLHPETIKAIGTGRCACTEAQPVCWLP